MEQEQKPRLIDQLPLQIYKFSDDKIIQREYVRVDDVENFLLKFTKPDVLQKVVKSLMFGHKLNLEDVLK